MGQVTPHVLLRPGAQQLLMHDSSRCTTAHEGLMHNSSHMPEVEPSGCCAHEVADEQQFLDIVHAWLRTQSISALACLPWHYRPTYMPTASFVRLLPPSYSMPLACLLQAPSLCIPPALAPAPAYAQPLQAPIPACPLPPT
eukprot:scaffold209915_cov20-Tisochrysis_lutea.AAC.3